MKAVMEQAFKAAANVVVDGILKMLDTTSLQDPNCLAALKIASLQLPAQYASVAEAKSKLDDLIKISGQLQQANLDFSTISEKKNKAIAEAKRVIIGLEEALQVTVQAIASAQEREANLMNQIVEIQKTLEAIKTEKEQLLQTHSAQDSEVQRLKSILHEGPDQEINASQERIVSLESEAEKLRSDLKNWRS